MIPALAALAVIAAGALLVLALGLCRMAGRPAPTPQPEKDVTTC